jgi:large subunit ribosomal protein L10
LALSKQKKQEVLNLYSEWVTKGQAFIMVEYTGVSMKQLDAIRAKLRETGAEFHIMKNTFARKVFTEQGFSIPADMMVKSTAVAIAFSDAAATAKALTETTAKMDAIKIKGGFLGNQALSVSQVKALAELPPLPVVRAQLLGTLQAPASKLVRTLAEPARSVAYVIQAKYNN